MMKAIVNGKIITPNSILENKVLVFDKLIVGVFDVVPNECDVIDANGLYVSPGLIDVHIHGCMGFDVMDSDYNAIKVMSERIAKNGVTSFLPTTMTMDQKRICKSLDNIRTYMRQDLEGAQVLGAHLEGPFVNSRYKGAQNGDFIIVPCWEFIQNYIDVIRLVTYAPECDIDFVFTDAVLATKANIKLSIGHSAAKYTEACKAITRGCSHITHLFNAMSPLNHRDPGVVGAALMNDVFVELIADKVHVNPELFQFVLDNKGENKIVLITDSMRAGCMNDGDYDLGGQAVRVKDGAARLHDDTLAGSVLSLNDAVRNFYENSNASISSAIKMASLNPAKSIGMDNQKGSLEIGKEADIALFDSEFRCHMTIVQGRVVFN